MSDFKIQPESIENNLVPVEILTPQSQSAFLQQSNIGNGNNSYHLDLSQGLWIGADKFADAPFSVKLDGTMVASGLTVSNVKYGKTSFTDSVNAGYHLSSSGFYFGSASDASYIKYNIGTGAFDFVGNVSGRASSVLASAINSAGAFINANLDTSAKTILGDFTFSPSDYSGAFKTGDITWNTTTGAITGGTGIVINKLGILGALSGVTKFSITSAGDATFAGTLSAAVGTLGIITSVSLITGNLERNDFHWFTIFESVDGYNHTTPGASATQDGLIVETAAVENETRAIYKQLSWALLIPLTWNKKRKIRTTVYPWSNTSQEIWIVIGSVAGPTSRHIGFKIIDGTLYGTVANGTTESTLNCGAISVTGYPLEVKYIPETSVEFFVNNVSKGTITTNLPSGTSESGLLVNIVVKTTTAAVRKLSVFGWDFWQEA